ncbi:uncharacterized protein LOC127798879 isoform X2 [Diospyros lotus]|uniref:uncharacterized protein LOC127798879 isoform X2 n=1 Tax=Diospyros lotus TaxID=55363 RepID=UPI0022505D2D|nr:uncharacterized protein LOC127798879 isoform X2 [Diospyros lotus]
MMNILAMCLVFSSLVTAGLWSANPERKDDVMVTEGRRVVVFEYEKMERDHGHENTKVPISPAETHLSDDKNSMEAASVLPNLGQGLSGSYPSENGESHGPVELVCDALGKCKQKIASAVGKGKEKVPETAHGVEEGAKEAVTKAKEETVSEKAQRVEEGAKEAAVKAKHQAETAVDMSKTIGKEVKRNLSTTMESAKEKAEKAAEMGEEAMAGAGRVKEEGEKELGEIFLRAKEVAYDVGEYMLSARAVGPVALAAHLLGFSTAYGMCMWVTFISSYVLSGALPRQQFGVVQSKIYPVYFRAMAYCVFVALLSYLLVPRRRLFSKMADMFQAYNLLSSLLMLLFNLWYLEPRATKVMFERMKMEKEEGRGRDHYVSEPAGTRGGGGSVGDATAATGGGVEPASSTRPGTVRPEKPQAAPEEAKTSRIVGLSERLKVLNAYSSFLNVLTLAALSWHLVFLSQHLHLTC